MQRVDGYYLYEVGSRIHPLADLQFNSTWAQVHGPAFIAQAALEPLITRTVFQLQTSVLSGTALLNVLREIMAFILEPTNNTKYQDQADGTLMWRLQTNLSAFEAVLAAEFALMPLFVVSPKGGLVLSDLIERGRVCFPGDLNAKVPEAIQDVMGATKCIAFELPTAAGFHLHRANEAVLRSYFLAIAPKTVTPPPTGNMGDYLKIMTDKGVGDARVIAALKQLKDLHRNPLMHPEQVLETVDEAISLMGAVRSAVSEMLKAIPDFSIVGAILSAPPPTSHSS